MLKLPWSKHVWGRSFSIVFNSRTEEAGTRNPHSLLHPQACCGSIKGRLKPSSRTTLSNWRRNTRDEQTSYESMSGAPHLQVTSRFCFGGPLMHQAVEPHFTSGWAGSLNAAAPWPAVSGCCGASCCWGQSKVLAAAGGPGSGLWDAVGTLPPWESLGRPICTGSAHVSSTKQAV